MLLSLKLCMYFFLFISRAYCCVSILIHLRLHLHRLTAYRYKCIRIPMLTTVINSIREFFFTILLISFWFGTEFFMNTNPLVLLLPLLLLLLLPMSTRRQTSVRVNTISCRQIEKSFANFVFLFPLPSSGHH